MAFEEMLAGMTGGMMSTGMIAAFMALGAIAIIGILAMLLALYVFIALAWMTIGNKLKYKKSWLAWIPIANYSMIFQLGGFHWAWVFLILVPYAGWLAIFVLATIATWRVFEKRKYPGWLALLPVATVIPIIGFLGMIAYLVVLGLVAWNDK